MTTSTPADQDVRDRVVRDLDTSVFLEAGAGAGKTSVIVARVVNLVRRGVPLSEIVAITFTEKAAGELRDRIRLELSAAGLDDALPDVDAAAIQTIHAFCAGILREHALVAGLHPDYRVLDQLQADLRFAQSWRTWLWGPAAQDEAVQRPVQRALELGLTLEQLQHAAEEMSRHRDLAGEYEATASDDEDRRSEAQRERDLTLSQLMPPLRQLLADDATQRRRDGLLTYDDLLVETRDLLARSRGVRAAVRQRTRALLIDEFQDTDPLQAQIALLIAADPDTDDWTAATPGPGRLVLAGDPKQSIYRFRRADIDVYEQVRDLFLASPETASVERLTVNFRARPSLSRWHNRVLPQVLRSDDTYPRAQARWESSTPYRAESPAGSTAVAVIPARRSFDRAPEAREAEARLLANLMTHIRLPDAQLGQLPDGSGGLRTPQYREIAVLVRTRTAVDLYTSALDRAGIPYHFDSGQDFYQLPEIRNVAQLLAVLDDPSNETAVAALLKSPLWSASDIELLQWRTAPDESRLADWSERIDQLRAETRMMNLPELIDHVLRASGLLESQAVDPSASRMRQRQANLRMLVQRAASFADEHGSALRPFVRWLTQRGARHLPESESATTEADDDAVRILTIHQAKGLEFPIVILPKLQDGPFAGTDFIVDRANDRLEFSIATGRHGAAPFRTPGYESALLRDRAYADAEARRMLYVAATRARDWLIMPSFPADSMRSRESFHTVLEDASPGWPTADAERSTLVLSPRTFDAAPQVQPELRTVDIEALRSQWAAWHSEARAGGTRAFDARTPSMTAPGEEEEVAEDHPADGGINPLDIGSAIHESLELADFDDLALTQQRCSRVCARYDVPYEIIWPHVERALQSDLMQRAARADTILRELPLTTISHDDDHTIIMNGIADLVFREDERWVLVDYKSDAEITDRRRQKYTRQLQQYALMLQRAGIPIDEAYLLLTGRGESVPLSLGNVSDL